MSATRVGRCLLSFLIVVFCAALSGCPMYYSLLGVFFPSYGVYMGDVIIAITLKDVSEPLTYNQAHMADAEAGTPEYSWGLQIDTDGDAATGDAQGFEVLIELSLKTGGHAVAAAQTAALADIMSELSVTPIPAAEDVPEQARVAGLAGNTLYVAISRDRDFELLWDEVLGSYYYLTPTFRTRFFARHNDPPDPGTEIEDTIELVGNGTVADSADDVAYPFIDIVEVTVDGLSTGAIQ